MKSPNDGFAHFRSALGLSGNGRVAILTFYGDASGKANKTNVAVAGYLASASQWSRFQEKWSEMLAKEGVSFFRRSQMEPPFFGEFRENNWTKEHQVPTLHRLHTIIKNCTMRGNGQSVKNSAFSQLMPPKIKQALGGPYDWCVQACITQLAHVVGPRGDYIHYVFEAGDDGQNDINKGIEQLFANKNDREKFRIASWSFAPKTRPTALVQLQAADFLAYESFKRVDNVIGVTKRQQRFSATDLVRPSRDHLFFWQDRDIIKWINTALSHPENEWWFS